VVALRALHVVRREPFRGQNAEDLAQGFTFADLALIGSAGIVAQRCDRDEGARSSAQGCGPPPRFASRRKIVSPTFITSSLSRAIVSR